MTGRAPASLINGALGGVELLAELVPNVAILDELRLCEAEYLPHLARPLLDGQRPKAHLQAGEEGGKGGRFLDHDSVLRLQLAGKARAADHLGEQEQSAGGGCRLRYAFTTRTWQAFSKTAGSDAKTIERFRSAYVVLGANDQVVTVGWVH